MNIITTDILTTDNDRLWEDATAYLQHKQPAPVLVITETLAPGSAEELQLHRMMEACKLSTSQYNVVYIPAGAQVAWHKLHHALQPRIVILLGMVPARLGISALMQYCALNRFDDTYWLPGPSMASMGSQQEIKSQFWNMALKPTFISGTYGNVLVGEQG